MSLKLHYATLSFGASVDQQTGNLSVFDLIEEIKVTELPVNLQSLVISLVLNKNSSDAVSGKLMIHIIPPDGNHALVGQGEISVPAEQKRMKAVFRFGGFPLMAYGAHRFVLSWLSESGKKEGEALLDFDVVAAPGSPAAEGQPPQGNKPPISH